MPQSLSPLGPHYKTVEELLEGNGVVMEAPKSYIQGRCPEIISNAMAAMQAQAADFVNGFENLQKGNDVLLRQWEEMLDEVEAYSKKLRVLKETLNCRISQLNSTFKR